MAMNATNRDQVERSIDRSLDDIGQFLRRRWWALVLLAIVVWLGIALVVPALTAHPPQIGSALLVALDILLALVFAAALIVGLIWALARPRATWGRPGDVSLSFTDYKGNPEVVDAARRIVTMVRGAKGLKQMGGDISQGLLLVGPHGAGKSYLAQCISAEAGVPFAYVSARSLHTLLPGADALMVKLLYRKARRLARSHGGCIIFLDEFDAIAQSRMNTQQGQTPVSAGLGGANVNQTGALNELLMQMDTPPLIETWGKRALRSVGLARQAQREPVLTIGATTAPEYLDAALLQPGRFDRKVVIAAPNDTYRGEVIDYYLSRVSHDSLPMHKLIADMLGYTPGAIKHVVNEAVALAHGDGRTSITYADITAARETHEYGVRYPRSLSALEKRRLAYHEAGHVIAQAALLPRYRVAHATIARRLGASGDAFVEAKPLEEIVTQSAEEIFASIEVALASRAAEEIFLQTRLNGAGADLANATSLALQYVAHWGMGDTFFSASATLAPERIYTDPMLRGQAERLLRQAYGEVRDLLERRRKAVIAIAEALLEREELSSEEIERLIRASDVTSLDQVAALSSMAEAALYGPTPSDVRPEPRPEPMPSTSATGERVGATSPAAPGPAIFAAPPSQELRSDRLIDRALRHAPPPLRQATDPNIPSVNPQTHGKRNAGRRPPAN